MTYMENKETDLKAKDDRFPNVFNHAGVLMGCQ